MDLRITTWYDFTLRERRVRTQFLFQLADLLCIDLLIFYKVEISEYHRRS